MSIVFCTHAVTCACATSVPFNNGKVGAEDSVPCVAKWLVTSSKLFFHSLCAFPEYDAPLFNNDIFRGNQHTKIINELFENQNVGVYFKKSDICVFFYHCLSKNYLLLFNGTVTHKKIVLEQCSSKCCCDTNKLI